MNSPVFESLPRLLAIHCSLVSDRQAGDTIKASSEQSFRKEMRDRFVFGEAIWWWNYKVYPEIMGRHTHATDNADIPTENWHEWMATVVDRSESDTGDIHRLVHLSVTTN